MSSWEARWGYGFYIADNYRQERQEDPAMDSENTEVPESPAGGLRLLFERVTTGTDFVAGALMLLLLATVFAMIITRTVFQLGFPWLDDFARYLQIWVVYIAAITLTKKGEHISMDALYNHLAPSWRLAIRKMGGIMTLVFSAVVTVLAVEQSIEILRVGEVSATGTFPAILGYSALPFCFCLITISGLYYLRYRSSHDPLS
jgi:TRAP-type C4-dicarboxylate transport system permease small subunit